MTTPLEHADIQGFVLFGYGHLPYARYLHVAFGPAGRANAWLAETAKDVTSAARDTKGLETRVHAAIGRPGFDRFGLSSDEIASFPREMQQGMGAPLRARVLGD